jgi:hypothetical protein
MKKIIDQYYKCMLKIRIQKKNIHFDVVSIYYILISISTYLNREKK